MAALPLLDESATCCPLAGYFLLDGGPRKSPKIGLLSGPSRSTAQQVTDGFKRDYTSWGTWKVRTSPSSIASRTVGMIDCPVLHPSSSAARCGSFLHRTHRLLLQQKLPRRRFRWLWPAAPLCRSGWWPAWPAPEGRDVSRRTAGSIVREGPLIEGRGSFKDRRSMARTRSCPRSPSDSK